MCTNPITATDKSTGGTVEFACRVCNECLSARKNDWVARAMAEKATSNEAVAIELTYRNNPDGTLPDAAKAFKYADVSAFLKALRQAYYRQYKARGEIRFIVAGERGSKKDRVHWHLILFADKPITALGQWSDFLFKKLDGPQISVMGRKARMIHWQYWPHGHVVVKEPDAAGMAYVLKYAMKDQFNVVRSKGTMRESKSENHGASYFRMSKYPPIGQRFLEERCDDMEARLVVPTSPVLAVPNYKGYWWPKGALRDQLLIRLHKINEARKAEYGRDCPQWRSLLASVESVNKDWELLHYGPQDIEIEDETEWEFERRIGTPDAKIRDRCGGPSICRPCYRGGGTASADYRAWHGELVYQYVTDSEAPKGYTFDRWYRAQRTINPFCGLKECPSRQRAFNARGASEFVKG